MKTLVHHFFNGSTLHCKSTERQLVQGNYCSVWWNKFGIRICAIVSGLLKTFCGENVIALVVTPAVILILRCCFVSGKADETRWFDGCYDKNLQNAETSCR